SLQAETATSRPSRQAALHGRHAVPRPRRRDVLREGVERALVRVQARVDDLPGHLLEPEPPLVEDTVRLREVLARIQLVLRRLVAREELAAPLALAHVHVGRPPLRAPVDR